MRKIKYCLCLLLSFVCLFACSGCSLIIGSILFRKEISAMLSSSESSQELSFEMIEDFSIMDVNQKDAEYITTVQAIVKNLGEDASNQFNYDLSFYDENGDLLGTESASWRYVGQGESMVIQQQYHLSYHPASVKAENHPCH